MTNADKAREIVDAFHKRGNTGLTELECAIAAFGQECFQAGRLVGTQEGEVSAKTHESNYEAAVFHGVELLSGTWAPHPKAPEQIAAEIWTGYLATPHSQRTDLITLYAAAIREAEQRGREAAAPRAVSEWPSEEQSMDAFSTVVPVGFENRASLYHAWASCYRWLKSRAERGDG